MNRTLKPPIEVAIGAEVTGIGGKLGEISRVIVEDGEVTAVVVKHGTLSPMEYVVRLSALDWDADGNPGLPLTEAQLRECEPFDFNAHRLPDEDFVPQPGLQALGLIPYGGVSYIARGPRMSGSAGPPPAGDWLQPHALQQVPWSSIARGAEVVDRRGDKVGEVAELALDSSSGDPSRVVVQSGFIRHHRRDLPLLWVETLEDARVVLRVVRDDVYALPTT